METRKASVRAKVGHPFLYVKRHFGYGKVRYRGLAKNTPDDCFMQYPEIDIGVNLMWKGLPLVTHIAGPSRAKRLVIGGERIHAPELREWGILDTLVPRAELMDTAREWASRYAAKSPIPAQMIKRSVNTLVSALDVAVMHMDVDQNLLSAMTEDRRAAIEAYRSGTEPTFKGS